MSLFIGTEKLATTKTTTFPNLNIDQDYFLFGLEAEFLLASYPSFEPLWHQDLSFQLLNEILEEIPFEDLKGNLSLLELEPPHRKHMPFVVEGYHIPTNNFKEIKDLWPKGLEIRTPTYRNIEECLESYQILYQRMQTSLKRKGLIAIALGHHPLQSQFSGPQNKRRHDYWQWAMEVMTTYGPDINISLPVELVKHIDAEDLDRKFNYYAPALTALFVGSPFYKGQLWRLNDEQGTIGKSYRTYKRSIVAPAIELHPDEQNRIEYKTFEMSPYIDDIYAQFVLTATIILSQKLSGRCDKAQRVYQLGEVAQKGLNASFVGKHLEEIFNAIHSIHEIQIDHSRMRWVQNRYNSKITLADELINMFKQNNDLGKTLKFLSYLR